MRQPEDWQQVLAVEPAFSELADAILQGRLVDYASLPPECFSWHAWDQLPQARLFPLILPFLRQQVGRASRAMPEIYAGSLQDFANAALQSYEDWLSIPLLVKDDLPEYTLHGFRSAASNAPSLLKPRDCPAGSMAFGSGGSAGSATPTYVTLADREREIQGWRRAHNYHGLTSGDTALYTYNTTHKGGQWMQESLLRHGLTVHLRRPEEDAVQVLENLRRSGANILFTVQQPYETMQQQVKSAGMNLHALVMASLENPGLRGILVPDRQGRRQIEFIFLGGFAIPPYGLELLEEYLGSASTATLLGSSEAIPQAASTNPRLTPGAVCHYNNLHLLQAPHYIEVLKPQGSRWVPVEKGETGLLVYSSWARDGTIWIRYAPGDSAKLLLNEGECPCGIRTPVITDVQRLDANQREGLLEFGCAAG